MSEFCVQVETECPPAQAWGRLWDLDRHTATIPLTTVTVDLPAVELAEGAGFTGRTAVGPLGFDDTMRVEEWRPPTTGSGSAVTRDAASQGGRAVVVKTGRLLGGRIEVSVDPLRAASSDPAAGCRVVWRQDVELPWLPSSLSALERLAARLAARGYRIVLRRLLA